MDYIYESESAEPIDNPPEDMLDDFLAALDGVDETYASLMDANGSYVQVGGGPAAFTVERREIQKDGTFSHLKAAIQSGESDRRELRIGGARVTVRADEILDLATVQQLFRSFYDRVDGPPSVIWRDITANFREQDGG